MHLRLTMKLRARHLAATVVALGLALYTQSANADAAGAPRMACEVRAAPYGQGVVLPSNAPALLLVDQTSSGLEAKVEGTLVVGSERVSLGAPTKDSHGLLTLALPATAVGKHSLELTVECTGQSFGEPSESTTSLTLTEPVAFPTTSGVLTHVPQNPPNGIDKVRFEPSPELRAFLPAAKLEVTVNGTISETRFGPIVGSTAPIELSVNTGDACIEDGALHREQRIVKVSLNAAIAGVAAAPSEATIDVPIDCGAVQWTTGIEPGKNNGGGGSTTTETAGTSSTSSSSNAGGCSATPVKSESFAATLGLVAAALLVAARRRKQN